MIRYGSEHIAREVDIDITAEVLGMFTEKARMDKRSREGPNESWRSSNKFG